MKNGLNLLKCQLRKKIGKKHLFVSLKVKPLVLSFELR